MKLSSIGKTDEGNVRTNNEDSFGVFDDMKLYIVADGMGGHNAGEVASRIAVDSIRDYFKDNIKQLKGKADICEFIAKSIKFANRNVFNRAQKNIKEAGMGTTVVLIFFHNKKAYTGWVGDSRAYLSRVDQDGKRFISQITTDHSLVEEQISEGIITREDVEKYNIKDIITRAVGFHPEVDVDCAVLKELVAGDIFMLCSDGLYRYFKITKLGNMFLNNSFKDIASVMIDKAKKAGGEDNVTVLTVKIDDI